MEADGHVTPGLIRAVRHGGVFVSVGVSAAGVHALMVWMLVGFLTLPPLLANVGGFLTAFWVSFFGHRYLSFDHGRPGHWWQALRRFALVATLAFIANEILYAALLSWTNLSYLVALVVVLGSVAVGTYILSRLWAFAPAS